MYLKAAAAGLAFGMGLGAMTGANAGFLDFLFGWRDRPRVAATKISAHPEITIRRAPRMAKAPRIRRKTPVVPAQISPQDMMARTIDPVRNPNWWLEDPTLRKGDVLVLGDRVLVFAGGPVGAAKSYVALSSARTLTRRERVRIAEMAGRRYEPRALAAAAPRQPRALKSVSLTQPALPPVLGAPRS